MALYILGFIVTIYFIYQQFKYETVDKLNYFILPLLSFALLYKTMVWTNKNVIVLLVILVVSIFVGYWQAKNSKYKIVNVPVLFYKDDGHERKIYKKRAKVRGGTSYLIGWFIIIGIQVLLQYYLKLSSSEITTAAKDAFQEIMDELFFLNRITDANRTSSAWIAWSIYLFSSLSYTLFLAKRHAGVKKVLFGEEEDV